MKTAAIICEYNPFHNGHRHHIDSIRAELGNDTRIVAIMSGNFVQRGEVAFTEKYNRARMAVKGGVDLVIELPFPFSMSCAEIFAKAGVHIANSIGIVDTLSFGSECGDVAMLSHTADLLLSDDFKKQISVACKENSKDSYPIICERVLGELCKEGMPELTANNTLALEYIKALKQLNSKITPHTVERTGAKHHDATLSEINASAQAIRSSLLNNELSALSRLPEAIRDDMRELIEIGEAPCLTDKLSSLIIGSLRLDRTPCPENIRDAEGGLYNRIRTLSMKADTFTELSALATTKKYTTARIRRAILNSLFGVTSSENVKMPLYSVALAMNDVGKAMLKQIRKHGTIPILTKPSNAHNLCDAALSQKELSDKADAVFQMTAPRHADGFRSLIATPYVKND